MKVSLCFVIESDQYPLSNILAGTEDSQTSPSHVNFLRDLLEINCKFHD